MRLLREDWSTATELAEELFAILNSDEPIEIDSPVTIINNTDQPPLTLRQFGGTDNGIKIEKYPDPPLDLPDIPPLEFPDGVGDQIITIILVDGTVESGQNEAGDDEPDLVVVSSGGGGGFPGKVISGTGSSYQVDVYEAGLTATPTRRTVTQLQIHADATIPPNTWALVGKVGSSYFMQVPVWGDDLT